MLRPEFVLDNKACVASLNFLNSHIISSEPCHDLENFQVSINNVLSLFSCNF